MKRFAAYCRVSTQRQENEQTIDIQKELIAEWATKNDAVIVDWYLDDGWSGELLARPELDRLRDDAKKDDWMGVVFVDRDRLARKLSLQELIIDELRDQNIEIIFYNEPLADNPEGRIMQQIKGVFAEYERAKITERMRRGKLHKARSGILVGHVPSYGYSYIPKAGDKEGHYIVNEVEAEIVRMIFHWIVDDGYSIRKVIKELYLRKISPPKKKSARWVKSSVERILNKKDYIGTNYYNKGYSVVPKHPQTIGKYKRIKKSSRKLKPREEWIAIPVPPIIDDDLFNRAHQRLQENKILNTKNQKYHYLLTGKVYCQCGSKRVGDGVNGHHYYRCAQRIYKYPLPNKCDYEGVNAEILDAMVWNKLLILLMRSDLIKKQADKWQNKQNKFTSKSQEELQRLNKALDILKEEEQRYLKAYASKLMEFEQFKENASEVKAKKELLLSQVNEVHNLPPENLGTIDINTICKQIVREIQYASGADRQKYVRSLIDSIYVGERSRALVNGRIPVTTQAQNIQDVLKYRDCWSSERGEVHII